ncbi:MAG: sugar transferase [Candidatus Zixiibacteriota bacterium]
MKKIGKIIWRFIEVVISLIIFIVALPFFLLAILLILIDSPGPILYKQKRIGKGGKPFELYKLRTMKKGANGQNPVHTQVNDPRFSRLCRVIRATTLDEIPQLFNVIKGEMSLIGPRPERPQVVKEYTDKQREVLRYVPGLFGVSQLAFREGVIVEKKIALEVAYYKNRSPIKDSKILLFTPYVIIKDSLGKLNGNSNGTDRVKWIENVFIEEDHAPVS